MKIQEQYKLLRKSNEGIFSRWKYEIEDLPEGKHKIYNSLEEIENKFEDYLISSWEGGLKFSNKTKDKNGLLTIVFEYIPARDSLFARIKNYSNSYVHYKIVPILNLDELNK